MNSSNNSTLFTVSTYILSGILINIGYKKLTVREKNIRIRTKIDNFKNINAIPLYNNISKFAIIDYSYDTYTIPITYFNKFINPYKTWNQMKQYNEYNIKYYGFNVPFLGLLPRIIEVKEYNHTTNNSNLLNYKPLIA
jgi:hypothetical protein